MKIYFMKQAAIDFFKTNMEHLYVNYYQKDDNSWMKEEFGEDPFVLFTEVPNFEMASLVDDKTAGEIDFMNCKIVYDNLKALSESQASDERLWAGLCNGTFYKYMRKRHGYTVSGLKNKEKDASGILSRFFFLKGTRNGFYRNTIAKCWWVGRATYDKSNLVNHFEMLDSIGFNDLSTKVSDIFYSYTFASNPTILKGICDALKYFKDHGVKLSVQDNIRPTLQYLNAVGGATLLDVLSSDDIKDIMIRRIGEILKGETDDIEVKVDEPVELDEVEATDAIDTREEVEEPSDLVEDNSDDEPVNLDFIEEETSTENLLGKPEFVTWGCYIKVRREKNHEELVYHIPLESDNSRKMWGIEERMLGKKVGHRIYLSGAWFELLEYGWDEDYKE